MPKKGLRFFKGMPLLPPRAGQTARIFLFSINETPIRYGLDESLIILKAAVEREKTVQAIDVDRECKTCVVTFWVRSQLFHFLGASKNSCADFRVLFLGL
jgi:hypothetical protein